MKSNNESVGLEGLIEQAATEKDSRGVNADATKRITDRITDLITHLEWRGQLAKKEGKFDEFSSIVDSLKVTLLVSKCEPLTPVRLTTTQDYTPDDYLDECVADDVEPTQYGFEEWAEEQFADQEIGECETTPIPND